MAGETDIVPRAELARILASDGALLAELHRWEMRHTRDPDDADDLLQDTLTKSLDPDYAPWDRNEYATAGAYLGSVMNGRARNRVRSSYMALRENLD